MSKQIEALPDRRIVTSAGNPEDYINSGWNECLDAIREALAEQGCDYCNHPQYAGTKCKNCGREQPAQQQEPVVVKQIAEALRKHGLTLVKTAHSYHVMDLGRIEAQTTSPQPSKPWVGLTDEEVDECYYWKGRQWTTDELVRHVEAKLREKNA